MRWRIRRIVNGCAAQQLVARRDVIVPEFISYGLVMPDEPQRRGRQMTFWDADGRIVPSRGADQARATKLGNASGGKAAKPTRAADRTPPAPSGRDAVLNRLDRITERAKHEPEATFNNVYSLLTCELLERAFRKLQRDKAPGVDGVTVDQYEEHLEENLQDLETRLHHQSDRPQPSLRREIRKENWQDATAGHRRGGGQGRPTGGRDDPGNTNLDLTSKDTDRLAQSRDLVWENGGVDSDSHNR